ncbi:MAG: metal-dependent transcriptional regulator [Gemmatimonadales bacterium]|jgi:DtxR family Mn-dependent transcriptional regulator|nr:metal-dependent transcriptional regulator [Gemmatimonadales bacterium]
MVDPLVALLLFALATIAIAVVAWPRVGLAARAARRAARSEQVRREDALKHCLTMEGSGRRATIESLAGALEVSRDEAARLAAALDAGEMVRTDGGELELRPAGRTEALRVVRSHRLVERYLADRTGVAPREWHDEAERLEHRLSADDAERLSARMGHPLVDPHGDPIPTARGELPERRGFALGSLAVGASARITHLEDEPGEIFARLVRLGLTPSTVLTRLPATGSLVRFRVDGAVHQLDALAAASVTVEPAPEVDGAESEVAHETLAAIRPGEAGRVRRISAACQGPQRRRLLDLGVVPGTVIAAEFASAAGDPVAYRVRGALIALRREHADWIQVERVSTGAGGPA